MDKILGKIKGYGIIPVIKIDALDSYSTLAKALVITGLKVAEITFRTECAADVISAMKQEYPDLIVGAGTVLTKNQFYKALQSQADFIVTPGYDAEIVDLCKKASISVVPGCSSATDLTQAIKDDLSIVKFFPSEALGGLTMIKALTGPFPTLRFMPTGGINSKNIREYLRNKSVLVCGGTWFINSNQLQSQDLQSLIESISQAIESTLGLKSTDVSEGDLWQYIIGEKEPTSHLYCKCEDLERLEFYFKKLSLDYLKKGQEYSIQLKEFTLTVHGGKANE